LIIAEPLRVLGLGLGRTESVSTRGSFATTIRIDTSSSIYDIWSALANRTGVPCEVSTDGKWIKRVITGGIAIATIS
jgi:hypothetical protein